MRGRIGKWSIPLLAVSMACAMAACVAGEAAPSGDEASRLAGRALAGTPMIDDLRDLCDRIGGRVTGSSACERAVEWAADRFRVAGLDQVTTESFEIPGLWLPGEATAECLEPASFPIRVAAAPFSPETPDGRPIEAPVVDAGTGTPEEFARLGARGRGAIALVRTEEMETLADLFAGYMNNPPMLTGARDAGAAAILLMSTRPRKLLYRHPVMLDAALAPLPVAIAAREDSARLLRLTESGTVRARLGMGHRLGGAYTSRNVVAEIRGREKPDEIVLLGAHLDSWDMGTGAMDNGVNVALVIDVARGIEALGVAPRRTVRFVLFTGEEQGLWGSADYVNRHRDEMDGHIAAVILDLGSGRLEGFYTNGRGGEWGPALERALAPVADQGPFEHPDVAVDGTDNFDFLLAGVPNLVGHQDAGPYLHDYHAESDVFERVDREQAMKNAAIASALVWSLAEAPERPAARQTRAEVEALIATTGLEAQMKAFGQWKAWTEGRRGGWR